MVLMCKHHVAQILLDDLQAAASQDQLVYKIVPHVSDDVLQAVAARLHGPR